MVIAIAVEETCAGAPAIRCRRPATVCLLYGSAAHWIGAPAGVRSQRIRYRGDRCDDGNPFAVVAGAA